MPLLAIVYHLFAITATLALGYYAAHKWFVWCINTPMQSFDKTPSIRRLMETPSVTSIHIGTFPFWSPRSFFFSVIDAIFFRRWLLGRITIRKVTDDGAGIMDAPAAVVHASYRGFSTTQTSTFTLTSLADITTYFKGLLKVLYMHVPVFINDHEYVGTLFEINKATMEETVSSRTETTAERLKRLKSQRTQVQIHIQD